MLGHLLVKFAYIFGIFTKTYYEVVTKVAIDLLLRLRQSKSTGCSNSKWWARCKRSSSILQHI